MQETYTTGKPCKNGHVSARYVRNRACVDCERARNKEDHRLHYQRHKEREKQKRRVHYLANRESYLDNSRRQHLENYVPSTNPRDKMQDLSYWANMTAKHKAARLHRTPAWADLEAIRAFYSLCPENYEVDHIVPLNGKLVSGLHVANNLQYLTRSDNASKGNKFNVA